MMSPRRSRCLDLPDGGAKKKKHHSWCFHLVLIRVHYFSSASLTIVP